MADWKRYEDNIITFTIFENELNIFYNSLHIKAFDATNFAERQLGMLIWKEIEDND